jgi:hypothetical protein
VELARPPARCGGQRPTHHAPPRPLPLPRGPPPPVGKTVRQGGSAGGETHTSTGREQLERRRDTTDWKIALRWDKAPVYTTPLLRGTTEGMSVPVSVPVSVLVSVPVSVVHMSVIYSNNRFLAGIISFTHPEPHFICRPLFY